MPSNPPDKNLSKTIDEIIARVRSSPIDWDDCISEYRNAAKAPEAVIFSIRPWSWWVGIFAVLGIAKGMLGVNWTSDDTLLVGIVFLTGCAALIHQAISDKVIVERDTYESLVRLAANLVEDSQKRVADHPPKEDTSDDQSEQGA